MATDDIFLRIREEGENLLLEYSGDEKDWTVLKKGTLEDRASLERKMALTRAVFSIDDKFDFY